MHLEILGLYSVGHNMNESPAYLWTKKCCLYHSGDFHCPDDMVCDSQDFHLRKNLFLLDMEDIGDIARKNLCFLHNGLENEIEDLSSG